MPSLSGGESSLYQPGILQKGDGKPGNFPVPVQPERVTHEAVHSVR